MICRTEKKRKLDKYMYDLGSCTFCMLCVTTCPQDALEFSNDFEQATFTRDALVKQLNYRPKWKIPLRHRNHRMLTREGRLPKINVANHKSQWIL